MTAWYNDTDKNVAAWLKNLIREGLICDGEVDTRSIRDVRPADLVGFDQCHFFAGIGLWSLALRWAGWPDDRSVWTGSCPCQPFSQAGRRKKFGDERHLWPSWHWLIDQRRPDAIFGEQVEGEDGRAWLDVVSTDLEGSGYACGPAVLPSASVGAPNARHRFYFVAHPNGRQRHGFASSERGLCNGPARERQQSDRQPERSGEAGWLADADQHGRGSAGQRQPVRQERDVEYRGGDDRLADTDSQSAGRLAGSIPRSEAEGDRAGIKHGHRDLGFADAGADRSANDRLGHAGGQGLSHAEPQELAGARSQGQGRAIAEPSRAPDPWRDPEWIHCLDGMRRPTEPGLFPLAPRYPGDVGKLRAYGNAINPVLASEVIAAYLDCLP